MQVWGGCNFWVNIYMSGNVCFCTCVPFPSSCTCVFYIRLCIHLHNCVSICMCRVACCCPVCLTQHILRSLSFALSLSLPLPIPPSPQPHSARLARTCMSVDSVLCLLPWHAPTSLQCSPVCINWQRDSGYVVCGVDGRRKKRLSREAGGNVRTQWSQ